MHISGVWLLFFEGKFRKSCQFFGFDSEKVADFLEFYYLCGQIEIFNYDSAQVREYSN